MKVFTDLLLEELAVKATESPRARTHFNIHASADDPVQRFIVVMNRQSYVRPHRHVAKSELAVVMKGQFDVVTFDDAGKVTSRQVVGEGEQAFAFELPLTTWHTLVARSDGSTFLEIKAGPYDPATAAEFAPWAPPEGDAAVAGFIQWVRTAERGTSFPPGTFLVA